jgi:hypothetical protein
VSLKLHSSMAVVCIHWRKSLRRSYCRHSCPGKESLSDEGSHEELALCVLGTYLVIVVVVRHNDDLFDEFD